MELKYKYLVIMRKRIFELFNENIEKHLHLILGEIYKEVLK